MGSLFRSEEMAKCQLFLQSEAAYACVAELGELGLAQFKDMNPDVSAFQRKFVNEVRRCDEMERKLRYLAKEIRKEGIQEVDTGESPVAPPPKEMIELEATIEQLERELREVNQNVETLRKNFLELTELKHVLHKTQNFFDEHERTPTERTSMMSDENSKVITGGPGQLGFITAVILRERIPAFERMLWRSCRGNVVLKQAEIEKPLEDPLTGDQVYKSVFIIFFQGDQLKARVRKICEGFRATLYPCPEAPSDRREMSMKVMTRLEDLNTVIGQTLDHKRRVLVAAAKNIKNWFAKVRKMKAIYHTLNHFNFDASQKCLIAECWVPVLDLENAQEALKRGSKKTGSSVPPILNRLDTDEEPPTYNRTNKFTKAFQSLINSYGVASYREINPTPYTIITFPFLFAVMFGDIGHGAIMAGFAAWLVIKEKPLAANKTDNEIWNIFFGGRYIILLMGIYSMYTGLIYNDIFSKSVNIFGSQWGTNYNTSTVMTNSFLQLNPSEPDYKGTPYPIGIDPVWALADNKIVFLNAFKMKMSIILGVIHMLFGVVLSLKNHWYFKNRLDIYCLFIPQLIFLTFLFLYMVIMMFLKWCLYSPTSADVKKGPHCAPSILIMFINMVLFKPGVPSEVCDEFMFPGQGMLQKGLVLMALVCVPWMLLSKPLIIMQEQKKKQKAMQQEQRSDENESSENKMVELVVKHKDDDHEGAAEIFIHQAIHTIEYVLGSVSHTASYLRLWALSLAHAQLSEVLWNMVLSKGFILHSMAGGVFVWAIFAFWAVLTVSILVLMEGLSAFLHTLRLHWVEFQSKFYSGLGYPFTPFFFEDILDQPTVASEE